MRLTTVERARGFCLQAIPDVRKFAGPDLNAEAFAGGVRPILRPAARTASVDVNAEKALKSFGDLTPLF